MSSVRLFVAFDTPPEVKHQALEAIERLKTAGADVSWEQAEKMHCTLKFLGSTEEQRIPAVIEALQRAALGIPPFQVRYRGFGCFPGPVRPRVLWAGIQNPDGRLGELQRKVENGMEALGFPREERAFHPHLTLGRVRSPRNARRLIEILERLTLESEDFSVSAIRLMSSDLKPSGSVYTLRETVPMLGNSL